MYQKRKKEKKYLKELSSKLIGQNLFSLTNTRVKTKIVCTVAFFIYKNENSPIKVSRKLVKRSKKI